MEEDSHWRSGADAGFQTVQCGVRFTSASGWISDGFEPYVRVTLGGLWDVKPAHTLPGCTLLSEDVKLSHTSTHRLAFTDRN